MLLRALVVSLVVHSAILLGARSLVPPFLSGVANSGGVSVLLAVEPSIGPPLVASYPVAVATEKAPLQSPKRLAAEKKPGSSSVFPGFSRSTVATDLPASAESSQTMPQARAKETVSLRPGELKEASNANEGVGEYRLSLAREARRFKRYPSVARERAWAGVVILAVHASAAATVPVVSISQSSGHQVLDAQAVEMMENALRLATMPKQLRGKQFAISLPIHYRLDD